MTMKCAAAVVLFTACASWSHTNAMGQTPQWVVAFRGQERPKTRADRTILRTTDLSVNHAAEEMARHMTDVLQTKVEVAPWEQATGEHLFLVTEERHAPENVRRALRGKRRDAFLIRYPCQLEGRKVCLLVSRDSNAYAFPVYYFLQKYLGVEWVGPDDGGRVARRQPGWSMPDSIDLIENPDYEHRAWSSLAMDARCWLVNGRRMAFHHGLHHAVDPRFHADKPELYPYYEGRRHVPDGSVRRERISRWQPCTSNDKVTELAAEGGLSQLTRRPEIVSFSLSVNDGGIGYCMCGSCLALDSADAWDHGNPWLTDRFYRFYNQVMERVVEENPNAYLAVLGYNRIKTPPTEVEIHPRIIVFNCVDNTSPITNMLDRQKAWKSAGAIPALYFRVPDLGFLTVRHYPHAVAEMIRMTHEMGGFGFYTETVTNWAAGGPRMYALAHLLWDTEADVDHLLDQYMRLAFGSEAASHARAYFDRWEEIWERGHPDLRYNTTRGNKFCGHLDDLTRADLDAMDAALARARAMPGSPAEKRRLNYVETYYQWLRSNADQYLIARELADETWMADHTGDEVFQETERGLALADSFDQQWETVISKDQTGWLISLRVEGDADIAREQFVRPIRDGVTAVFEAAVDRAFDQLTKRMLRERTKAEVVRFWRSQVGRHPKLMRWCDTQSSLLEGPSGENLIANGDFEAGTPGGPPRIEGWAFRGAWQGVPTEFAWQAGAGRGGSRAAAIGRGRAGELGARLPTVKSARYRFAVWYKTCADLNPAARVFLHGLPAGRWPLSNSDGHWRRWSTTFTAPRSRMPIILEVKGVDKDEWVWFDDAELVRISGG